MPRSPRGRAVTQNWRTMPKSFNRRCTKCLVIKKINDFYKKRNQRDTTCKECKRSIRKAKYQFTKNKNKMNVLIKFFDIIFDSEIESLKRFEKKCDKIIKNANLKKGK